MQFQEEVRDRLLPILQTHNTMTLSTVDERGIPWGAILFYAPQPDLSLVFISNRESSHCQHIERCSRVSVSIHEDGQHWKGAAGFQIAGDAERIPPGEDRDQAKDRYLERFSFIRKVDALRIALTKMDFYRVRPRFIRRIDNSKGLGFKEEWGEI